MYVDVSLVFFFYYVVVNKFSFSLLILLEFNFLSVLAVSFLEFRAKSLFQVSSVTQAEVVETSIITYMVQCFLFL